MEEGRGKPVTWGLMCGGVRPSVWLALTQAVGAVYRKAHEDDVSVWVGERSQPVIVLLACSVPECQLHLTEQSITGRGGVTGEKQRGERG